MPDGRAPKLVKDRWPPNEWVYDQLVRLVLRRVFDQEIIDQGPFSPDMSPETRLVLMHRDPFDVAAELMQKDPLDDEAMAGFHRRYDDLKREDRDWQSLVARPESED